MKRWLKWGIGIIAGLIILLFLILFLLIELINPNDYKKSIENAVHEKTGLYLSINGNIKWQFFPGPGFSVENLKIQDKNQSTLATLKHASAHISLTGLLARRIDVQEAVVDGVDIHVIKKPGGEYNWPVPESKQAVKSTPLPKTAANEKTAEKQQGNHKFSIRINKVRLDNIDLHYQDKIRHQDIHLSQAYFSAEKLFSKKTFPVVAGMIIKGNNPTVNLCVTFAGNVLVDSEKSLVVINDLDLSLKPLNQDTKNNEFKVTGNASVQAGMINFNLHGSPLVLQDYLPTTLKKPVQMTEHSEKKPASNRKTEKSSSQSMQEKTENTVMIPVPLLQAFDLDGKVGLEALHYNKIVFEHPSIKMQIKNGVADISRFAAGFYGGSINGKGKINTQYSIPNISLNADMKNVNLEKAGQAIHNLDQFGGQANANLRLLAQGITRQELTRTLNGVVSFQVDKGQMKGANMNLLVCRMVADIRHKKIKKKDWPSTTRFNSLKGSWNIENSIARTHDMIAKLDNLNLNATGWSNISNGAFDYNLGLTVTGSSPEKGEPACQINPRYADITWPVRCHGQTGKSASCGIDERALQNTVKTVLKREAEHQLKKELMKHFGNDGMGKKLEKLLH